MVRFALRFGILLLAFAASAAQAGAQPLTINYDFTPDLGFYSADRQQAIIRAGDYIRSQIDARGTINMEFDTFNFGNFGPLAQAGSFYAIQPGVISNGVVFRRGTTNTSLFTPPDGSADWNSNGSITWYTGSTLPVPSGQFDMQSIALHELSHALGFASLIDPGTGAGLAGQNIYSRWDTHLRVGTAANAPVLINPDVTFNSSQLGALTGNNIYFHGEMAMAANGGAPVRLAGGGDLSHLHSDFTNAVMLPAIGTATARRAYQNVEMAMLIDVGWNQFVWKNNSGNWNENISSASSSRWANLDGDDMLSPVGTVTPNLVLRFGGSGGYTSTNGLNLAGGNNRFLVNRIILNATGGTSTIESNGTNVLRFDTTIGITPLVRQDGAGAFNITHPIELTARNLELGGAGTGKVSLGGAITGGGGITKIGASTFELNGAAANTYTGTTTVSGGLLIANKTAGVDAIAGNVTLNTNGRLRLDAANQLQGDGTGGKKVTFSGGLLNTGATTGFSDTVGAFEMTASSAIDLGGNTHTLRFTGISGTPTGTLTIFDWAGGTGGKIEFAGLAGDPNTQFSSFLAGVNFQGVAIGATFLDVGGGVYEIVPVPEPATVLAIAFGTLALGAGVRRRWNRPAAAGSGLSA
jgi:autotransporter-associated beta strand protein